MTLKHIRRAGGNTWYFGYKAHIGVDKYSGLVHTVKATPANVYDVTMMSELLTGEEEVIIAVHSFHGTRTCDSSSSGFDKLICLFILLLYHFLFYSATGLFTNRA